MYCFFCDGFFRRNREGRQKPPIIAVIPAPLGRDVFTRVYSPKSQMGEGPTEQICQFLKNGDATTRNSEWGSGGLLNRRRKRSTKAGGIAANPGYGRGVGDE